MKWVLSICCVVGMLPAYSQQAGPGLSMTGQPVGFAADSKPALLARMLTSNCPTDLQKVRAIFRWITDNIEYRTRHSRNPGRSNGSSLEEPEDTGMLKPLDERVAETVLENRLAICDGYARLFKTLCDYAGIESVVITGYARTEAGKRIQRFRSNHSWNAVRIDSAWQLLDVTWASGYITWQGDNFVRYYDEQYFLTAPDQFIREHYPDDLHWTLMTDPPLMQEFRYSPYKQRCFSKYKITSYRPAEGLIEVNEGDTLDFEIGTKDAAYDNQISSDPFLDTAAYRTPVSVLLVPARTGHNTTGYTYVVNSVGIQWVYILYNDDLVLRYKLHIRSGVVPMRNR